MMVELVDRASREAGAGVVHSTWGRRSVGMGRWAHAFGGVPAPRTSAMWYSIMKMGCVFGLLVAVSLSGCSSPEDRYAVLSFFFDGVPDPNAVSDESQGVGDEENVPAATEAHGDDALIVEKAQGSMHSPYADYSKK